MKSLRYLLPVIVIVGVVTVSLVRQFRVNSVPCSKTMLLMDTLVEVTVWGGGQVLPEAAVDSALAVMARLDKLLGDGRVEIRDGVATTTAGDASALLKSREFGDLLDASRSAYDLTGGIFDPTIGSVTRLWTWGEDGAVPHPDSIAAALARVGLDRLSAKGPGDFTLDFGGVAKGYAVGLAARKMVSLGFRSAIITAGGDMCLVGIRPDGEPWRIAIRHPRRPGAFIGFLKLSNTAVSTSGDYERCFVRDGKRYHHILDPRTGMPGGACASVTVVSANATLNDALSTGLFLMGPRKGARLVDSLEGMGAVFVWAEGESVLVTQRLADKFERAPQ
jgi:thiamine biosynthesis lipoprotein